MQNAVKVQTQTPSYPILLNFECFYLNWRSFSSLAAQVTHRPLACIVNNLSRPNMCITIKKLRFQTGRHTNRPETRETRQDKGHQSEEVDSKNSFKSRMDSSKIVCLMSETIPIIKSGSVKRHSQTKHRASFEQTNPLKSDLRAQNIKYFMWYWIIMQILHYNVQSRFAWGNFV